MCSLESPVHFSQCQLEAFDIAIRLTGIVLPAMNKSDDNRIGLACIGFCKIIGLADNTKRGVQLAFVEELAHIIYLNESEANRGIRANTVFLWRRDGDFWCRSRRGYGHFNRGML